MKRWAAHHRATVIGAYLLALAAITAALQILEMKGDLP